VGRPGTFGLHQQTGFVAGIGVPAAWLVARRRAGVPEVPKSALMVRRAVARSVGIRAGAVSVQETRYVLGLLRRIQPELGPVIEEQHGAGVPFPVIGRRAHLSPTLVRLYFAGSARGPRPRWAIRAAEEAWRSGAPRAEVARWLDVAPARVAGYAVAAGWGQRLRCRDITAEWGWSLAWLGVLRREGLLVPGGREGFWWWWRADVEAYCASRSMVECECGAMASPGRGHWRRDHRPLVTFSA